MNEPLAPGVTLDALSKYYKAGYSAMRKYTQSAYVILSNRLGPANNKELLSLASGLPRSVIDVHYYNLFYDKLFKNMTLQQNIDFIYKDRAAKLQEVTQSNGPLSFVGKNNELGYHSPFYVCYELSGFYFWYPNAGEWTAEWELKNAPIEDYVKAQLEVYGNTNSRWSLRQLIINNSINLKG